MGSIATEESVLDEKMKVRGVENLRVVDASSLPDIPNGNIQETVLALAQFAVQDMTV